MAKSNQGETWDQRAVELLCSARTLAERRQLDETKLLSVFLEVQSKLGKRPRGHSDPWQDFKGACRRHIGQEAWI